MPRGRRGSSRTPPGDGTASPSPPARSGAGLTAPGSTRELQLIESAAGTLEADLRQLAGAIRDAADAARVENTRRSGLRAQYQRDHPEEFAPARVGVPR